MQNEAPQGISSNNANANCDATDEASADDTSASPEASDRQDTIWPVRHIRQASTWDCGLVCSRMLIEACGGPAVSEAEALEVAKRFGVLDKESLWTIDICCILNHYNVPHTFCTTYTGASEELKHESFYAKTFSDDSIRVNQLFADAATNGLEIEKRKVPMAELVAHLRGGGLAIILIDGCKLRPPTWYESIFPSAESDDTGYYGHFLLACGVDATGTILFLADPASQNPVVKWSTERIDVARTARGTDDDIILVLRQDGS